MVYALNRSVYFLIALAILGDLVLWGFMQVPVGSSSIVLFYTLIAAHGPLPAIGLAGFISLWERFIFVGTLGGDLLLMMPLGVGCYYIGALADIPRPFMALGMGAGVALQRVILYGAVDPFGIFAAFLSAGIMVYLVTGSQGNRLRK